MLLRAEGEDFLYLFLPTVLLGTVTTWAAAVLTAFSIRDYRVWLEAGKPFPLMQYLLWEWPGGAAVVAIFIYVICWHTVLTHLERVAALGRS